MKSIYVLIIVAMIGQAFSCFGQNSDSFINGVIERVNEYYQERPHDNLYLHTDRSVYFPGDEIFFKAYVNDAATLLPSTRSNKFTLLVLDQEGNEVYSSTVEVIRGESWGQIQIPDNLEQGLYYLVGFVMNNKDITANKVFNKPIFLADPSSGILPDYSLNQQVYQAGDNLQLNVNFWSYGRRPDKNLKLRYIISGDGEIIKDGELKTGKEGNVQIEYPIGVDLKSPVSVEVIAESRKVNQSIIVAVPLEREVGSIDFFPEGGSLIVGFPGKLAFQVLDRNGFPVEFEGALYEGNRKIREISTIGNGIGIMELIPDQGKEYMVKSASTDNKGFPLPEVSNNTASLRIKGNLEGKLNVATAYTGPDYPDSLEVLVAIFRKGILYWSAPGTLSQTRELSIPVKRIPPGVSKLVLFTKDGRIISERVFYLEKEAIPEITLSLNREAYNTRQNVELDISLQGFIPGNTERISMSVSVIPIDMQMSSELLLNDYMMVESDIQEDGRELLKMAAMHGDKSGTLDAMLLTYTWNGYSWDRILGTGAEEEDISSWSGEETSTGSIANIWYYPADLSASGLMDISQGISDKRHPGTPEPHYKKQLESGMSVLEVIKSIKPYSMDGSRIVFAGTTNSINYQQGALIVIDNQQMGENASILSGVNPAEVETINISTNPTDIQQYTGLNVIGVIEITMKGYRGDSRLVKETPRDLKIKESKGKYLEGYPDYNMESDTKSVLTDHRPVIFWQPDVLLDEDYKAELEFSTSDTKGSYLITVQGMVGTYPVAQQRIFEVK